LALFASLVAQVPAFVEADGNVVLESGAIALYIADKYGDKEKLFGEEKKKGQLFQWLFYAPATMYPLVATAYAEKHIPDAHKDPARVARAKDRFQTCIELIDSSLGNNHFLLGTDHPTLADIFVSYELFGSFHLGWLEEATHPRLKAYLDRMGGLECFKKTYPSG
jgi:glutathione S-transferase